MPIIKDTAPVFYPDDKTLISKYIDLTKFLSLLVTKSLFFCRLDKLEDQFEGTTAKKNFQIRVEWYKETNHLSPNPLSDDEILKHVEELYEYEKKVKEVNCVCCWNKAHEESAALWKIYSDFGKGIMIKTRVEHLVASLSNSTEAIRLSEIKYLNYDNDIMPDGNTMFPITHKQNAYKYEEEIRLIYEVDFPQIGRTYDWDNEEIREGKLVKVDIDSLIDEIIIGPYSPEWMTNLVSDLVDKYGLKKPVTKSKLSLTR